MKVGKCLQVDKRRQKLSPGLKTEGNERVPGEQKSWETCFPTGAEAVEERDVVRVVRRGESGGKTGTENKRPFLLSYPLLVIPLANSSWKPKRERNLLIQLQCLTIFQDTDQSRSGLQH